MAGRTWAELVRHDMDMRDYDPAIGRWLGIDPVTHFSQSPYNAFDNNPVSIADPSGADGIRITIDWNQLSNNAATVIQHADSNISALEALQMAILSADVYDGLLNVGAIGYTRDPDSADLQSVPTKKIKLQVTTCSFYTTVECNDLALLDLF